MFNCILEISRTRQEAINSFFEKEKSTNNPLMNYPKRLQVADSKNYYLFIWKDAATIEWLSGRIFKEIKGMDILESREREFAKTRIMKNKEQANHE